MMMFGGSPISVAVPPMFEARISEMRKGAGFAPRRCAMKKVTGVIKDHGGDVVEERRSRPR